MDGSQTTDRTKPKILNVVFWQIVISPFLGVKKGHVHSNHREKVPKSLCAIITPFSKCPPSTPVQCVHHFCSLRTSSVLAGFTSIFCFVFDTTNKWAGHFERSDFFCSSLPGMNHLNWVVILHHLNWLHSLLCTSFYFNFHVTIEHQPCNKPNLYTQYACFISAIKLALK